MISKLVVEFKCPEGQDIMFLSAALEELLGMSSYSSGFDLMNKTRELRFDLGEMSQSNIIKIKNTVKAFFEFHNIEFNNTSIKITEDEYDKS